MITVNEINPVVHELTSSKLQLIPTNKH